MPSAALPAPHAGESSESAPGDAPAPTGWGQRMRRASTSTGARRGGLALVDQALASATNFLTMVFIGKFGSEESPGVYTLCFSIVIFVSVLQERMLATPYMVFLHRQRPERPGEFLGSTLFHLAISIVAASLGLAAYGIYLAFAEGATPMTLGIWVLVFAAPAYLLREFLRSVAFAHMQMRSAIVGDSIVLGVQVVLLGALAALGRLTVPAVFVVVGAATALSCLSWYLARPLPVAVNRRRVRAHWRQHWGYSRWLVAGRLVGNFSRFAMPWIVLWAANKTTVSQLAVCSTLVGVAWVFIRGVSNYLRPLTIAAYVRGGPGAMLRVMWQGIALFVVTLGTVAVFLWLAGDWFLATVFKPEFAVAAGALAVLGFNSVITSVGMSISNALSAVRDTRNQFWGEVVTLVVTLGTAWPLVSGYGVTGAAWSLLAGAAASLGYMAVMLARDIRRQASSHAPSAAPAE